MPSIIGFCITKHLKGTPWLTKTYFLLWFWTPPKKKGLFFSACLLTHLHYLFNVTNGVFLREKASKLCCSKKCLTLTWVNFVVVYICTQGRAFENPDCLLCAAHETENEVLQCIQKNLSEEFFRRRWEFATPSHLHSDQQQGLRVNRQRKNGSLNRMSWN